MKRNDFKEFCNVITNAENDDPIWSAGFAFMNLTDKQHEKVWNILNERGFEHKEVKNYFQTSFDGIVLPNGLVLLKCGNMGVF